MSPEEARRQVAEFIYRVVRGDAEASELSRQYPEVIRMNDESIGRACHALGHYDSDSDIRRKDEAYAKLQTEALKAIADQMSQGLPLTEEHGYW